MENKAANSHPAIEFLTDVLDKIQWANEQIRSIEQNTEFKKEHPAVWRVEIQNFLSLRQKFTQQLDEFFEKYNLEVRLRAKAA